MTVTAFIESTLDPADAVLDIVVPSGEPYSTTLTAGQILRIVDLEGNQAVDTLLYNADDPVDRYSAPLTVRHQGNIFLTTGSRLLSSEGHVLATIVSDTCGRHDTSGGACSAESNTCRFGPDKQHMLNCRDTFLLGLARHGMGKRDLVSNINFFMNVPVTADGRLDIVDGISRPGAYVELRAEMRVLVLISNCAQLNNPCNGWNPTPVRLLVWDPSG
jgi:urea carboxylase-associated protein 1